MKYLIALLFSVSITFASEKDSLVCFTKPEVTKLWNKIQLIRDSVEYLTAVVNVQDTVIDLYVSRSEMFIQQLKNRDEAFAACKKRSEELEKINQELQPRWYDNKFLWFLTGAASVVGIILVVQ
jgi:hypothetical protein